MTPGQANEISPALTPHYDDVNRVGVRFEINTKARLAAFLAQCAHESAGFKLTEENLNYSTQALLRVFGKYYASEALAAKDARRPERIANRVYGGRMGNTEPGDGYRFRGRGWIMITGRENYTRCSEALFGDRRLVIAPDSAAHAPLCVEVAAWYWQTHGCNELADTGDFEGITRAINGGLHGHDDFDRSDLDSRMDWWIRCKAVLGAEAKRRHPDSDVAVPPPELPEWMQ